MGSYPQGSTRGRMGGGICLRPRWPRVGVGAMSNRNADAVVPFAPKLNGRSETGDTLDRAGQAILDLLTERPVLLRRAISRPLKWLTNYPLKYEPLKAGCRA